MVSTYRACKTTKQKLIYIFNSVSVKIPEIIFIDVEMILKCIWNKKIILKKSMRFEDTNYPISTLIISRTVWDW